ncbi:hypothetical protein NL676_029791 [Syzygium grande]|nr:hypothetical protein NL676_029791 [Syzygium grande]
MDMKVRKLKVFSRSALITLQTEEKWKTLQTEGNGPLLVKKALPGGTILVAEFDGRELMNPPVGITDKTLGTLIGNLPIYVKLDFTPLNMPHVLVADTETKSISTKRIRFLVHWKIVQCDMKPKNVLLDWRNNLKLADFGSAIWLGGEVGQWGRA